VSQLFIFNHQIAQFLFDCVAATDSMQAKAADHFVKLNIEFAAITASAPSLSIVPLSAPASAESAAQMTELGEDDIPPLVPAESTHHFVQQQPLIPLSAQETPAADREPTIKLEQAAQTTVQSDGSVPKSELQTVALPQRESPAPPASARGASANKKRKVSPNSAKDDVGDAGWRFVLQFALN